jgi:hypothetical protein
VASYLGSTREVIERSGATSARTLAPAPAAAPEGAAR